MRSAHGELDDLGNAGGVTATSATLWLLSDERTIGGDIILLAVNERGNQSVAIDFNKQLQKLLQWSTNDELGSLPVFCRYVVAGVCKQMAEAALDCGRQRVVS